MAKEESIKLDWKEVSKDNFPIIPENKPYVTVLVDHPDWDEPSILEYWRREDMGGSPSDSLWADLNGELTDEPTHFVYLNSIRPKHKKPDTYGIYLSKRFVLSTSQYEFIYSLVNMSTTTRELPNPIISFKALSLPQAQDYLKNYLDGIVTKT